VIDNAVTARSNDYRVPFCRCLPGKFSGMSRAAGRIQLIPESGPLQSLFQGCQLGLSG
jgi:hypothetical protein